MTNQVGPHALRLVRREYRAWQSGQKRYAYVFNVPNAIAETVPEGTHFFPVVLADGSILFKRWDPADFARWLVDSADIPADPLQFVDWWKAHNMKPEDGQDE